MIMANTIFNPPEGVVIKYRGNGEYVALFGGSAIGKIRLASRGLANYCNAIWVHRDFQRLGIAKAMMSHIETTTGKTLSRPPAKYVNNAVRRLGNSFRRPAATSAQVHTQ